MTQFFETPALFETRFQDECKPAYTALKLGQSESEVVEQSFVRILQEIDIKDQFQALDTIVQWLKHTASNDVVETLLNKKISMYHWNWSSMCLGVRLLAHSNDTDLITLSPSWSVFESIDTVWDLIEINRLDLFEPLFCLQPNLEWLHDDVANMYQLKKFFTAVYELGEWDNMYNVLRTNFSFRWTAAVLDGCKAQVETLLNDLEFQTWSHNFDYFSGLYHEQINTYHAYHCLKQHNLFKTFGVDPQLLAARTFATILWDPPQECTKHHKPHYPLAIEMVSESAVGQEQAQFFELFGRLIEERLTRIAHNMGGNNIGANSYFTPDQLFEKYFTEHFKDFFDTYTWDTATAEYVLRSSSWFLNLSAVRHSAPLQAAILKVHIGEQSDTISKSRKI